jgi:hypothetical protein
LKLEEVHEEIHRIENKRSELNLLINEFKSENQVSNQKEKRRVYNKKYYQQMKNKLKSSII